MGRGRDEVAAIVQELIGKVKTGAVITPESPLYEDGIDMDSLQAAELSALLEDEFGTDPYSEGTVPYTVAEIVDFYDAAS